MEQRLVMRLVKYRIIAHTESGESGSGVEELLIITVLSLGILSYVMWIIGFRSCPKITFTPGIIPPYSLSNKTLSSVTPLIPLLAGE